MRSESQKRKMRILKNRQYRSKRDKRRDKSGAAFSGDPERYLRNLNQDRQYSENQMRGPGR